MDNSTIWSAIAQYGSIRKAAQVLGIAESTIRRKIGRMGAGGANTGQAITVPATMHKADGKVNLDIKNGRVIVFSDAHFEPNVRTTSFRALLSAIKKFKPVAIICNGDAFDGGSISRYPRIGWDKKPSVKDELDAVETSLEEIEDIAKGAQLIWPLGNHDARYETYLAAHAPQYEGVQGFSLKDRFPFWKPCWTCWINDETCITHFYHTGMHAVWNNLVKGQCNYVSSHRHSPEVRAYTNARGNTLYGVDTGTLAEAMDSHNTDYMQGRHGNHRSAFAMLTYVDGQLLMPELIQKWDEDTVQFRGELLNADTFKPVQKMAA